MVSLLTQKMEGQGNKSSDPFSIILMVDTDWVLTVSGAVLCTLYTCIDTCKSPSYQRGGKPLEVKEPYR